MPTQPDTNPPLLDTVVRSGDDSIIQSTRFGQQVLDQLQAMQRDCEHDGMTRGLDGHRLPDAMPISFPALDEASSKTGAGSKTAPRTDLAADSHLDPRTEWLDRPQPETLDQRIDALIDGHVDALKRDLLALLSSR